LALWELSRCAGVYEIRCELLPLALRFWPTMRAILTLEIHLDYNLPTRRKVSQEIMQLLEIMEICGFMEIYEYNGIYLK
jgi:hypothetical protein